MLRGLDGGGGSRGSALSLKSDAVFYHLLSVFAIPGDRDSAVRDVFGFVSHVEIDFSTPPRCNVCPLRQASFRGAVHDG